MSMLIGTPQVDMRAFLYLFLEFDGDLIDMYWTSPS
jgi:hypothetical protein